MAKIDTIEELITRRRRHYICSIFITETTQIMIFEEELL